MKNLTWQNPEQLFVAQELINKVKSKCCGIKEYQKNMYYYKLLLLIVLQFGVSHVMAINGNGTAKDPYLISNATDLADYINAVNKGVTVYGELTANITTTNVITITGGHAVLNLQSFTITQNTANEAVIRNQSTLTINATEEGGLINTVSSFTGEDNRRCINSVAKSKTSIVGGKYTCSSTKETLYFEGDVAINKANISNNLFVEDTSKKCRAVNINSASNIQINNTNIVSKGNCLYISSNVNVVLRGCNFKTESYLGSTIYVAGNCSLHIRSGKYANTSNKEILNKASDGSIVVAGGLYNKKINYVDEKIYHQESYNGEDNYTYIVMERSPEVILNANGGVCGIKSIKDNYGKAYTLPTPTRQGYTFMGWEDEDGELVSNEQTLTMSMTFTARWEANVVIGGDVVTDYSNIALPDNKELVVNHPITADNVTYTRLNVKNQWGTIVLPFDVIMDDANPYKFYKISELTDETLCLQKTEGTLAAGTPALMCVDLERLENNSFSISTSNVALTSNITPQESSEIVLTGSYVVKNISNVNGYIISNNRFWSIQDVKGDSNVYCAPYRAYLEAPVNARQLAISDMNASAAAIDILTSEDVEYYDINGRRIAHLQKGINIVRNNNGKAYKIFVK